MAKNAGYLGRVPGDNSVVIAKQVHQPTGVQTDFTFASGYTVGYMDCLLYTSPSPRDRQKSRMPSSA